MDINGKELNLEKGQPSFVNFNLRMMDNKEKLKTHYIRIDSTDNEEAKPHNANNNFWINLKDTLLLNENSKFALIDISFPNSICNITKKLSNEKFFINQMSTVKNLLENELEDKVFNIPANYYSINENLIWALNYYLPNEYKNKVKFSESNKRLKIESLSDNVYTFIKIPNNFLNILGLNNNIDKSKALKIGNNNTEISISKNQPYIGSDPINVMYNYPSVMLCHTNFVQHSIIGDSFSPVFKIIPTENVSFSNYISVHSENLEFIKTNSLYLKNLHFQLKNLDNELIEFADDRKIIINFVVKI